MNAVPLVWPLRIHVTCERCRFRQTLERMISEPGQIDLICHSCELPLEVVVPSERSALVVR